MGHRQVFRAGLPSPRQCFGISFFPATVAENRLDLWSDTPSRFGRRICDRGERQKPGIDQQLFTRVDSTKDRSTRIAHYENAPPPSRRCSGAYRTATGRSRQAPSTQHHPYLSGAAMSTVGRHSVGAGQKPIRHRDEPPDQTGDF